MMFILIPNMSRMFLKIRKQVAARNHLTFFTPHGPVPSLKLTCSHLKNGWLANDRFLFWDGLISGAASLLLSGSVETSYFLPSHSDMSQPPGTCQRTTAATQRSNEASWAATIGCFKPFSASENQPTKTWVFRVYIGDSTTQLYGGIPIKQPGFNGKPTKKKPSKGPGLKRKSAKRIFLYHHFFSGDIRTLSFRGYAWSSGEQLSN